MLIPKLNTYGGHDEGGDDELHLQGVLHLGDLAGGVQVGGDEGGDEAHQDAGGAAVVCVCVCVCVCVYTSSQLTAGAPNGVD